MFFPNRDAATPLAMTGAGLPKQTSSTGVFPGAGKLDLVRSWTSEFLHPTSPTAEDAGAGFRPSLAGFRPDYRECAFRFPENPPAPRGPG